MLAVTRPVAGLYVDKASQQWIVRDPEGRFWSLPSTANPWHDRRPFSPAEETQLESAIYRGVDDGSIRTAADFNALTSEIFAQYDPTARQNSATPLYWARDRLFFTDPLYDVNYLYAGLLALTYFNWFEREPRAFSSRYVGLLENGFNDTSAELLRRFLGIELSDERALVESAARVIDARTQILATLYSSKAESH